MYRILFGALIVASIILSACGPAGNGAASSVPSDLVAILANGYGTIRVSQSQVGPLDLSKWMFVPNTASIPANAIRTYGIASLAENGFLVGASQTLTLTSALTLIASLSLGNTVQNVTEGRNLILQVQNADGTTSYWEVEPNGHILVQENSFTLQAVASDTSIVQEQAEGKVNVDSALQKCETEGGCMNEKKIAVIIDDDPSWQNIIAFHLQSIGFEVKKCAVLALCNNPDASLFIVDAQDPMDVVVGPGFVRDIRANPIHKNVFIIGISGRLDVAIPGESELLSAQFMAAGANAVWDKGKSAKLLLDLLPH